MLKFYFFLISISIVSSCFSQGLNFEKAYNDNFHQDITATHSSESYSYMAYIYFDSTKNNAILRKVDTNGVQDWRIQVEPIIGTESNSIENVFELPNHDIIVTGRAQEDCDVSGSIHNYILRYNSNGVLLNSFTSFDPSGAFSYYGYSGSLIFNNSIVNFGLEGVNETKIYHYNISSNTVDSSIIPYTDLTDFAKVNTYNIVTASENTLYAFDNSLNLSDYKLFSSVIRKIKDRNDTLFVLTSDSIFIYDNSLNLLNSSNVGSAYNLFDFSIKNNEIILAHNGYGNITVYSLSLLLQFNNSINFQLMNYQNMDFLTLSSTNFNHINKHNLTQYSAIRHFNYSIRSSQNSQINTPNIGLVGFETTYIKNIQEINPHTYSFDIAVKLQIKNFSTETINSARINHNITTWSYCHPNFYSKEFNNLSIPPNGTAWVSLDTLYTIKTIVSLSSVYYEYCAFSSHPNRKTDISILNDEICKYVYLGERGTINIDSHQENKLSISPNPTSDYITISSYEPIQQYKIYNTTGQRVQTGKVSNSRINVASLPTGYYVIELQSGDQRVTKKLIIE